MAAKMLTLVYNMAAEFDIGSLQVDTSLYASKVMYTICGERLQ